MRAAAKIVKMSSLDDLLASYRAATDQNRDKGTYFERLILAYLSHDPVQVEEYEAVWTWADWARENGRSAKDIGIDLVAKLRNEDGFAAIQCKFYDAKRRIQKAEEEQLGAARRAAILDYVCSASTC